MNEFLQTLKALDLAPFVLSLKLAGITTLILFFLVLPLAYFLSTHEFKGRATIETLANLPLVLPPSVLGFYLLIFLSPYSFFGEFIEKTLGLRLVFNFYGLVIASCIYSLPFMLNPLISGFRSMPKNLVEVSYSLGKGKIYTLFHVSLPAIKPSLLSALVISFAHTMGEFGVVLMIGGSVSSETKVASIAIYEYVEILDYKNAHIYSGIMLLISFFVLFLVYKFNSKIKN